VQCLYDQDCRYPDKPYCHPVTKSCTACFEDKGCSDAKAPICQFSTSSWIDNKCGTAQCASNSDCKPGFTCSQHRCRECGPGKPCKNGKTCNNQGICVECVTDADCKSGEACDLLSHICHPKEKRKDCHPCLVTSDCSPGYVCSLYFSGGHKVERRCVKRCQQQSDCHQGYECSKNGRCLPRWSGGTSCASMWTRGRGCLPKTSSSSNADSCGLGSTIRRSLVITHYESHCDPKALRCRMTCEKKGDCPEGFSCDVKAANCIKSCRTNRDCAHLEVCDSQTNTCR
jgi:Cys-rich repeat protein